MITSKLGKLIIVDDEIDTLTPLCDLLSEWGYEVKGFTSGKDALEALKEKDSDMLLTDLVMPEMDGIELMKAAMEMDPLIVCIIITGKGTIRTAVEAMKNGAFDYILKPLDFKVLKLILSRAMEVRRLRKSEERYRTIVEDQTELICRWKPGEILTFVNDVYCRYFNMKPEELIGKSFMTLIPEEDREDIRRHSASISVDNPVSTHEHRVIRHDGNICWHQWTNRAIFDGQGQVIEFQSVGRDITERKLAEEALRESEERYRELADSITDVFFAMDKDLKYIYWNKASENLVGVSEKEAIGKSLYDIFPDTPETRSAERIYLGVLSTQQPQNFVNKFQIKDKEYYFEINVYPSKQGLSVFVKDITERKRAEEMLQVERNKLQSVIGAMEYGLTIQDLHYNIIYQNEVLRNVFGDRVGEKCYLVYEGKDKVCDGCPVEKTCKDGKPHTSERRVIMPSGKNAFWENTASPIRDSRGKIVSCLEITRDITGRKQAEKALRESEARYRDLYDNAPDMYHTLDENGVIFDCNETEARMLGYGKEEIIGRHITDFFTEESKRLFESSFTRLKQVGTLQNLEREFIRKDGTTFPTSLNVFSVYADNGKFISTKTIARDITIIKKVEEALKESEQRFRTLVENSPVGIWQDDVDQKMVYANKALQNILEVDSLDEISGENWRSFFTSESLKKIARESEKRLQGLSSNYEVDVLGKRGNKHIGLICGAPLFTDDKEFQGTIATFLDITDRKRAEEELKKSHRQLRDLAARLSEVEEAERRQIAQELHDQVGQNLTALGINLNILPSLLSDKVKAKISTRLEDMHKLLGETVKKIRDVMADLRPSVLDDYGLIAALLWYSEQFSNRTGITTVIRGKELEPRMPSVVETTLFRIVQESLTNVSKHAQASKVTIKLTEKDNLIQLSIADHGIGFDPENIQQSKERYVWGLISMKERAIAIGGDLHIKSKPGKGTKITVEIKRTA